MRFIKLLTIHNLLVSLIFLPPLESLVSRVTGDRVSVTSVSTRQSPHSHEKELNKRWLGIHLHLLTDEHWNVFQTITIASILFSHHSGACECFFPLLLMQPLFSRLFAHSFLFYRSLAKMSRYYRPCEQMATPCPRRTDDLAHQTHGVRYVAFWLLAPLFFFFFFAAPVLTMFAVSLCLPLPRDAGQAEE